MKKLTFALMALLAFSFSLKAQQYVSTQPANRNVILEEFTGRNCTWCPSGHVIANQIMANNPGRAWAINVHAGGFSPTTFPNLNNPASQAICSGFGVNSFPTGVVNRSTASAIGRDQWTNQANNQLNQASECNIAGIAIVNPDTRIATITVEVYYTGNSSVDENYLTVAMLQDSILGSQTGMNDNPAQVIGNQYCHMHVLRDIITTSVWGDPISPTTQGTLITRTFEYAIPESIGNPNGVEVNIDNIFFLAWVSERFQGTPTRPILTGCELDMVQGSNEPIYPSVTSITQNGTTCSHTKDVEVSIQNIGTEVLNSMTIVAELNGETYTTEWEGELPCFGVQKFVMPMEVPFGTYPVVVTVTEANGVSQSHSGTGNITCLEWQDLEVEGDEEELRIDLMQDKFGNHITWEVTASDGTLLGSGGPYNMLAAGSGTQLHIEYVTVPVNECVKFTINDQMGNGICCSYGQGYYLIKDSQGNVIIGDENDGEFGASATHLISVKGHQANVEVGETEVFNVDYNHAEFLSSLTYDGYPDEVGFSCLKETSSEPMTIPGILNEFRKILGSTDELEPSSVYMVRAYAIVNGQTFYGSETTFQTETVSVDELESSLKLYPNPTANVLNIEGEGMMSVEVYNTVGQRIMAQEVNGDKTQVNTESLNNGMYFIRILANDGSVLNRTFSVAR